MNFSLRLLFMILPRVLNRLANNPAAWNAATESVMDGKFNVNVTGQLKHEELPEFFASQLAPQLEHTKHPTRLENFLREAAVLWVDWQRGVYNK